MLGRILDDLLTHRRPGRASRRAAFPGPSPGPASPFPSSLDPRIGEALRGRGIASSIAPGAVMGAEREGPSLVVVTRRRRARPLLQPARAAGAGAPADTRCSICSPRRRSPRISWPSWRSCPAAAGDADVHLRRRHAQDARGGRPRRANLVLTNPRTCSTPQSCRITRKWRRTPSRTLRYVGSTSSTRTGCLRLASRQRAAPPPPAQSPATMARRQHSSWPVRDHLGPNPG